MEVIVDERLKTQASVVALGMFDGVHLGHQVLVRKARSLADQAGVPLIVCTFMKHPLELIAPEKTPAYLTTFEEKVQLLKDLGVDYLYAMPFTVETMNQLPECYVGELVRRFHPTDVVCGYNHSFGKGGAGSPALLEVLGAALGFRTSVVPKITYQNLNVSSSIIRNQLGDGMVSLARKMLARPYCRLGTVAGREGTGTILVMPPNGKQTLPPGRYRVLTETCGKAFPAVLTITDVGRGRLDGTVDQPRNSAVAIRFLSEIVSDCR